MQLPDILNVAIGLMVLFLLLSTIASVLAEIYGRALRYREEILYITVSRLLTGLPDEPWSHARLLRDRLVNLILSRLTKDGGLYELVKTWEPDPPQLTLPTDATEQQENTRREKIVKDFWNSPPLRAIISPGCDAPERLSKEAFTEVLLGLVLPLDSRGEPPTDRETLVRRLEARADQLPAHLRGVLTQRVAALEPARASGPGFAAALREVVGAWYEEAMKSASDRYRRLMQRWLLVIGAVLALALNADAVRVLHLLGRDPDLAQAVAAYAELSEAAKTPPPEEAGSINAARAALSSQLLEMQQLSRLGFPLGWTLEPDQDYAPAAEWLGDKDFGCWWLVGGMGLFLIKLLGLGITVLAVSQGAPFWYDLLQKITALRRATAPEVAVAATGAGPAAAGTGAASVGTTGGANSAPPPLAIGTDLATGAPGFEPRRAYWLAELARLAYAAEPEVKRFASDQGFAALLHLDRQAPRVDTQVFAFADRRVAVVAFRGTEPDVLADILSDADLRFVPADTKQPTAGKIHAGFARAEAVVAVDLIKWLGKHAPTDGIIHLTGHSLGGALATVFAARLARHAALEPRLGTLHTFGCPRVGDADFTRALDARLGGGALRFVHALDPVPMVPPASTGGYRHLGLELCFQKPSGLRRSPAGLDRLLGLAAKAAVNLRTAGAESVADHSMDDYVARCLAETGLARLPAAV